MQFFKEIKGLIRAVSATIFFMGFIPSVNAEMLYESVLSKYDKALYAKVFSLQEKGKWRKANTYIRRIDNKILMGHVQYQRLMHPTAYRARYSELHKWMIRYNDHPNAKTVFRLAKKRRLKGWKSLTEPAKTLLPKELQSEKNIGIYKKRQRRYKYTERRALRYVSKQVQRGNVSKAYKYLKRKRRYLTGSAYATGLGDIARGYYRYHKDSATMKIANIAYSKNKKTAWEANWWAGLSAYRIGNYKAAELFFNRIVYKQKNKNIWVRSAAYYWAGRSAYQMNNIDKAREYWANGGQYAETFYGLISNASLGKKIDIDFSQDIINYDYLRKLEKTPALQRSIALVEVGRYEYADKEIEAIQRRLKNEYQGTLMHFAELLTLPYSQFKTARYLKSRAVDVSYRYYYPEIPYKPNGKYVIDNDLIQAFVRQESQYRPHVKSGVGARGLMQLMPYTAQFMARKIGIKPYSFRGSRKNRLFNPQLSATIGQAYIKFLLDKQGYNRNLFFTVTSYNAGPGNIRKWKRKIKYNNDPLLFIESLPSLENRIFVERVISNFWIYRLKNKGYVPSLMEVAQGRWPFYKDMRNDN